MVEDASVDAEGLRENLRGIAKSIGVTVFPNRAAAVRAELTERNTSVRFLLKGMTKLDIKADEGHRAIKNHETLKKLYEREYTGTALDSGPTLPGDRVDRRPLRRVDRVRVWSV